MRPLPTRCLGVGQVPGVEGLDLDPDPELGHLGRHRLEHGRGVGHHVVALAEVHRPAVEGADLGHDLADVLDPLGGAGHVGPVVGRGQRLLDVAEDQVAAHAGGQVEYHVGARGPDPVGHLLRRGRRPLAGSPVSGSRTWMWTMAAPALAASMRRVGDLGRRDRDLVGLVGGVAGAGHGAGDEDAVMHGGSLLSGSVARVGRVGRVGGRWAAGGRSRRLGLTESGVDLVVVEVEAAQVAVAALGPGGLVAVAAMEDPAVVEADEVAGGERVAQVEPGVGGQVGEAAEGVVGPGQVGVVHVGEAADRVEGPDGQWATAGRRRVSRIGTDQR